MYICYICIYVYSCSVITVRDPLNEIWLIFYLVFFFILLDIHTLTLAHTANPARTRTQA